MFSARRQTRCRCRNERELAFQKFMVDIIADAFRKSNGRLVALEAALAASPIEPRARLIEVSRRSWI